MPALDAGRQGWQGRYRDGTQHGDEQGYQDGGYNSYRDQEEPWPPLSGGVSAAWGYGQLQVLSEKVKANLPDIADEKGMIFVTPDALNSWYIDSPIRKDLQYETFTSKELIEYIDSHYPTLADRKHRAVTGLSMGGHGALYLAFRHKDVYGACGSMSGGVDFRGFPQNWEIKLTLGEMAHNRKRWDANAAINQIDRIQNHDLDIIIDCGEGDFFIECNKALHERLLGRGIDHDFITRPGGHNPQYWNNSIDYQLLFFQKYFAKNQ